MDLRTVKYDAIEYVSPEKANATIALKRAAGFRCVLQTTQAEFEKYAVMPDWIKEAPTGMAVLLFRAETKIVPPSFEGILDMKRPLCFFDLETTGLDPEKDRIIEIAIYKLEADGVTWQNWHTLVKPPEPISDEIVKITGIKNEMLDHASTWPDIAQRVHDLLLNCDLGGHNVRSFDIPFLENEFKRVAMALPWPDDYVVVDTLEIARRQIRHTLEMMWEWYVMGNPELAKNNKFSPHRAMDDVWASVMVYRQQLALEQVGGDLQSLDQYFLHPYLDRGKWLEKTDEGVVIRKGNKHSDEFLIDVMQKDMTYIDWMIDTLDTPDTCRIVADYKQKYLDWKGKK